MHRIDVDRLVGTYVVFEIATGFALNARVIDGKGQLGPLHIETECHIFRYRRNEDSLEGTQRHEQFSHQ